MGGRCLICRLSVVRSGIVVLIVCLSRRWALRRAGLRPFFPMCLLVDGWADEWLDEWMDGGCGCGGEFGGICNSGCTYDRVCV